MDPIFHQWAEESVVALDWRGGDVDLSVSGSRTLDRGEVPDGDAAAGTLTMEQLIFQMLCAPGGVDEPQQADHQPAESGWYPPPQQPAESGWYLPPQQPADSGWYRPPQQPAESGWYPSPQQPADSGWYPPPQQPAEPGWYPPPQQLVFGHTAEVGSGIGVGAAGGKAAGGKAAGGKAGGGKATGRKAGGGRAAGVKVCWKPGEKIARGRFRDGTFGKEYDRQKARHALGKWYSVSRDVVSIGNAMYGAKEGGFPLSMDGPLVSDSWEEWEEYLRSVP